MRTIGVVGLGYIGLPTAATLASCGYRVHGFDVAADVVETINRGEIHIVEEGLGALVAEAVRSGRLQASTQVQPCDIHIVAVPTPINEDKSPGLEAVRSAAKAVGPVLRRGDLVIVESTIPPRTCVDLVAPILESTSGLSHSAGEFLLAHCPERVLPGRIMHELIANDRVVGGTTPEATRQAAALYGSFVRGQIFTTDATTAEAVKLMENTFRDVNIALANEMAAICDGLGIDGAEAIRLANRHPRVNIHSPGIGVGGHCIPVDPWFLVHAAPETAQMISLARRINDARPHVVADRIVKLTQGSPGSLALLGLAFKADVDDLRESPAIEIAHLVADRVDKEVLIVEPHVDRLPNEIAGHPRLRLVDLDQAIAASDRHVVLVPHRVFSALRSTPPADKQVVDAWTLF